MKKSLVATGFGYAPMKARRKRGDLALVRGILEKALKRKGLDKDIEKYQFVPRWKEIVGEDLARRTTPECIRNGTLVVRVLNSVWAQELSFHKESLIKRLKRVMGPDCTVTDIHFQIGALK